MTGDDRTVVESSFGQQVSVRSLSFFRRSWWLIVSCAMVGAVLGVCWSLTQTPMYEATVRLYVTSGTDADAQSAYQGNLASQQRVASYVELVQADSVISGALADSALNVSVERVKGALSAKVVPETVLLEISARDPDPSVARTIADSVSDSVVSTVTELETPVAGTGALAKVTVVSPARLSDGPVTPKTERNTVLGFLAGGALGFLASLVRLRLDNRIRSRVDLSEVSTDPVLGVVPSDSGLQGVGFADFRSGANPSAEAYRRLRANLQFVAVDKPARIILVTSPSEGEGKTTTAMNLAASFADAGSRVALVSGDLRKPGLSSRVRVQSAFGFTDYLIGRGEMPDLLQSAGPENLDILSAGELPPNPAELLSSKRAADGLAMLATMYDFVIIDSAPILPVVDSVVLASFADGVVLVARSGGTTRKQLELAFSQMKLARLRVLGTVLNDVDERSDSYQYSYYGSGGDVAQGPRVESDGRGAVDVRG